MPDSPLFNTEVLPIRHIAIPGHSGAFAHPSRNYRIVINTDDNQILGMIDKTTGFISHQAVDSLVRTSISATHHDTLRTDHQTHFRGREAELVYMFLTSTITRAGFNYTFTIRIRNSLDLSVNKHAVAGLQVSTTNNPAHSWFVPFQPEREHKLGRYGTFYASWIRSNMSDADMNVNTAVQYYQAMRQIPVSAVHFSNMSMAAGTNTFQVRRIMGIDFPENLFGIYMATNRMSIAGIGTGKSSPTAINFRRRKKLNDYIHTNFNDQIREAMRNEETTTDEDNNEGHTDDRNVNLEPTAVADDAPIEQHTPSDAVLRSRL